MKKILAPRYLMLFILGISLCLPSFVHAFPAGEHTCPCKELVIAVLGITDDQMAAFDELRDATEAEIEPLAEEMRELCKQMPEILLAEEIDTVEAEAMLGQKVDLGCQISSIGANAGLEGVQILTPEQRNLAWLLVGDVLGLTKYIVEYPGWDKIKEDFEKYIGPVLHEMIRGRISKRLGFELTDGQMAAFDELRDATEAEIKPLAEEMNALGWQLPEILLAEEIDTVEAEAMLGQKVDLDCQISSIGANAGLEGVQILTPEQRQIIKEKREEILELIKGKVE